MALTDSLQLSEEKDKNANVVSSNSQSRNFIEEFEYCSLNRGDRNINLNQTHSVTFLRSDLHNLACLEHSTELDSVEMKEVSHLPNTINTEENNNVLPVFGNLDVAYPIQMVKYFQERFNQEKFQNSKWIQESFQQCFHKEHECCVLHFSSCEHKCNQQEIFSEINGNYNVSELDLSDYDGGEPIVMESKGEQQKEQGEDVLSLSKRPRTETQPIDNLLSTEADSVSPASTATTSWETGLSYQPAQALQIPTKPPSVNTPIRQTVLQSDAGVEVGNERSQSPASMPGVIHVTTSMKSCRIVETKQASTAISSSNTGPLSINAQMDTSVTLATISRPIQQDLVPLPPSCDVYMDTLLDSECILYSSRLTSVPHLIDRGVMDPLARILTQGDDMHFIPIDENNSNEDHETTQYVTIPRERSDIL